MPRQLIKKSLHQNFERGQIRTIWVFNSNGQQYPPIHPRQSRTSMRHSLAKTVTPREVWAWAMYDFAGRDGFGKGMAHGFS